MTQHAVTAVVGDPASVDTAIETRFSARAFLPRPVPRETIEHMYFYDRTNIMFVGLTVALDDYAEFVGVPPRTAMRVRDEFFPKNLVNPDEISGLDSLVKEAVNLKFIERPLTAAQLAELIQIPPRKK